MDEQRSGEHASFRPSDSAPENSTATGKVAHLLAQGEAFLLQRRWKDAEQLLRHALTQGHADVSIIALLARTLLVQGKPREARELINSQSTATSFTSPAMLLLRAQILLEMGERQDAIVAFQYAIAAAPDNGNAHLGLAVALGQDGQSRAAHASATTAITKGVDHAGSRSVLARSLYELHRYGDAETEYRKALRHSPWNIGTHVSLAELIWLRTRDVSAALAEVDRALLQLRDARAMDFHLLRARLLFTAGHREEALGLLEQWIPSNPNYLPLRILAIKSWITIDPARAAQHAAHAMQLAPGHTGVIGLYGDAMLAAGQPKTAVEIAQRLLGGNPHDNHAIALQAAAWRLLGDPRHLPLHDYASLVRSCMLDVPDGWSSLPQYLDDLASELRNEHELLAEPLELSVRGGTQVEHRTTETDMPAVRAFPKAVDGALRRYISALGIGDTAWHRRSTGHYRLAGLWSVRLKSQGHHVSHYHGQGWLSSACYVQMPKAVNQGGGQGWLKFGEPGLATRPALDADYYVQPVPGMIVLFPSWMWHGTVPFTGATDEHRLTMAFDAVPTAIP
nr:tetratricopeptide repeat protein [Dyella sp. ASV24]